MMWPVTCSSLTTFSFFFSPPAGAASSAATSAGGAASSTIGSWSMSDGSAWNSLARRQRRNRGCTARHVTQTRTCSGANPTVGNEHIIYREEEQGMHHRPWPPDSS
uniref:Secreted protein n=1 Tax=Arundo donax TaxID=35708 RepID=A0A0A9BAJ3_ARUDO